LIARLVLAFQDSHDRNDCVPAPCRRRRTEQFVDLAETADCFHVTTVHSEHESILRCHNSHEPLAAGRNSDWNGSRDAAGFRKDAHESNDIRAFGLGSKRVFDLHADEIACVAEHHFRFEWQLPEQFSTELCSRSRFTNDKRACATHIDDIKAPQLFCEEGWAKRPVSANIDTAEKNNERHGVNTTALRESEYDVPGTERFVRSRPRGTSRPA